MKELDYKHLLSDQGFMVYMTQTYPGMKPYLKGFHLLLETWREGQDKEGWKLCAKDHEKEDKEHEANPNKAPSIMEDVKIELMTRGVMGDSEARSGPIAGFTLAAPCFKEDLEAILVLAQGEQPAMRRKRSKQTLTAYYGFGDASSAGFGLKVERPNGLHGQYGLWGADKDHQSSNYRAT